jgi:hypothetical protein
MSEYGISEAQFKNAKSTISKSYKARCRQGWAAAPRVMARGALRADQLDIVAENLDRALSERLSPSDLDAVTGYFWNTMTELNEPTVEGPLANVAIGYVAGCVMYAALDLAGLSHGNLGRVAEAVELSPAGLTNRLKNIQSQVTAGQLPEARSMFTLDGADEDSGPSPSKEGAEE